MAGWMDACLVSKDKREGWREACVRLCVCVCVRVCIYLRCFSVCVCRRRAVNGMRHGWTQLATSRLIMKGCTQHVMSDGESVSPRSHEAPPRTIKLSPAHTSSP
mmetsp:Transcript_52872/g.132900  ORF Transcript_52872/g.132900 Transcript_52872/m.132900 type:complete len:104 (-) Transcript_52872:1148-1459(-)